MERDTQVGYSLQFEADKEGLSEVELWQLTAFD